MKIVRSVVIRAVAPHPVVVVPTAVPPVPVAGVGPGARAGPGVRRGAPVREAAETPVGQRGAVREVGDRPAAIVPVAGVAIRPVRRDPDASRVAVRPVPIPGAARVEAKAIGGAVPERDRPVGVRNDAALRPGGRPSAEVRRPVGRRAQGEVRDPRRPRVPGAVRLRDAGRPLVGAARFAAAVRGSVGGAAVAAPDRARRDPVGVPAVGGRARGAARFPVGVRSGPRAIVTTAIRRVAPSTTPVRSSGPPMVERRSRPAPI